MSFSVTYDQALSCCASTTFAKALSSLGPFVSLNELIVAGRKIWWTETNVNDWLQALAAHPKIGDKKGVEEKKGQYGEFSRSEAASSVQTTTETVAEELKVWNAHYYDKFGFIFIIFAKGKTAPEILKLLKLRYARLPYEELQTAAAEQMKITELRLTNLLRASAPADPPVSDAGTVESTPGHVALGSTRSPITTHVLDTASGKPAEGLSLSLQVHDDISKTWSVLGEGVTNSDGRVGHLLSPPLAPGRYRMFFDTTSYFTRCHAEHPAFYPRVPFYPEVVVDFQIVTEKAGEHYHIPLLLSPFGYSTYRGS